MFLYHPVACLYHLLSFLINKQQYSLHSSAVRCSCDTVGSCSNSAAGGICCSWIMSITWCTQTPQYCGSSCATWLLLLFCTTSFRVHFNVGTTDLFSLTYLSLYWSDSCFQFHERQLEVGIRQEQSPFLSVGAWFPPSHTPRRRDPERRSQYFHRYSCFFVF